MKISREKCTGCEVCLPYCVVGAIHIDQGVAVIDEDNCVECGSCIRNVPCPTEAFSMPPLEYPRLVRQLFSDNLVPLPNHPTMGAGRGVIEVKTNDRTNYYKPGEVGFFIEMGRPGVGSRLRDAEKVLEAFTLKGYPLVKYSSLASIMADWEMGKLKEEVLNEKVLSCTLEFRGTNATVPEMIGILREVEKRVDTVFSVGVMCRVDPPYEIPVLPILAEMGVPVRLNAKINVGLGKPPMKQSIGGRE